MDRLACEPDLILLDLMMPFMDGREFLRRMRGRTEQADTPVIVISAAAEGLTVAGAQAVMQKPFDAQALLRHVSGLLAPAG